MTDNAVMGLRRRGRPCRVIAHRGYSAAFPENTIEAYDRAIQAGADLVEIDLRISSDGEIVCHHDPATGGAEISALRADALAARGIARLADVLPTLFGRVGLLLDLKRPEVGLAADALSLLQRNSMSGQTVIGVRSLDQARFVHSASPDSVVLGFLKDYGAFPAFFEAGGDIARLWEEDCRPDTLAAARCGDHPVWVTAGRRPAGDRPGDIDRPRLDRLFALNIDGVLVNDPVLALCARRARDEAGGAA
jgi:glycerophosphoryl diester phosphodiesterase